jgi:hypothetical protein
MLTATLAATDALSHCSVHRPCVPPPPRVTGSAVAHYSACQLYELAKGEMNAGRMSAARELFDQCAIVVESYAGPADGFRNLAAYRTQCRAHSALAAQGLARESEETRRLRHELVAMLPHISRRHANKYAYVLCQRGLESVRSMRSLSRVNLAEELMAAGLSLAHAESIVFQALGDRSAFEKCMTVFERAVTLHINVRGADLHVGEKGDDGEDEEEE